MTEKFRKPGGNRATRLLATAGCSLTLYFQSDVLLRCAELVLADADVYAGIAAVQRHYLQRAVRRQPVAARVAIDLNNYKSSACLIHSKNRSFHI